MSHSLDINSVELQRATNRVLDFGPPLPYQEIGPCWTVERISLWEHTTEDKFQMVAVQAAYLQKARAAGTLYSMTDAEVFLLDRVKGAGIECERKLMPVFIRPGFVMGTRAADGHEGTINVQLMAWVYIHNKTRWVDTTPNQDPCINAALGSFKEPARIAHPNPLLNGSYNFFLPPPYDQGRVGTMHPKVLRNVRRRNKQLSRRIWLMNLPRKIKEGIVEFVTE